ncbi:YceI family protein [Polaribacter litorisediminis]|uniref:YceI family protein n=1 Tax=Polaribacter litorisediminis TaxID=1908341 RepID=UPI001CBC8803|nr:YceI family protein [Polaribacter litorisediminis]UAM98651.1 YceI family protein [Polaribacter litorisediminis]
MKKIILLIVLLPIFFMVSAQEKSQILKIKLPSTVIINGTSTLHDWESIVEKTVAQLATNELNNQKIETLNVSVEVISIKSGKNLMDKLTYKALKYEDHPNITFIFKKGEIINEGAKHIDIKLIGDLTIAGVTKSVAVETKINKSGKPIILKGSHKLKMTDFGIEPPKALLGTIKTGNEITIAFNLTFE